MKRQLNCASICTLAWRAWHLASAWPMARYVKILANNVCIRNVLAIAMLVLAMTTGVASADDGNTKASAPSSEVKTGHIKPDFSLANTYHGVQNAGQAGGDQRNSRNAIFSLSDYWMSEKYDGVRAFWDGRHLISRGGNTFAAPVWFTANLPTVPLDGELWAGRGRFEDTVSIVRRALPHDGWRDIRFMVFDLPEHGGVFRQRYATLQSLLTQATRAGESYWQVVTQQPIISAVALDQRFITVTKAGGEGLMLRRIESRHRSGRSDDLLKYKLFSDAEAVVTGHNPGKGKYTGALGSLRVVMPSGKKFSIGSGLSDAERRNPPPLGAVVTYKYQGLTRTGLPRFPVFLRIRRDEPK